MNRFTRLATQAVVLVMILFLFSKAGWGQTAASPQSRFYAKNIKRIDSFNLFLRTWCDSVIPATVKEKSVKEDKENIRYISKIYNTAMSYKDFVQDAKKEELVRPHAMRAGLVSFYEYKPNSAIGYLSISIWLTVIDDRIIYKKFEIINTAKRKCATNNVAIPFFDYVYLKQVVNDIDFPIEGCANCDSLVVDTLYQSLFNEVAQKYPDYKFIPDVANEQLKDLLFKATFLQDSYYHNKVVPEVFIQLVKLKEYETITSLLYSPNHLMAVNAYEALVYLRSSAALEINSQVQEKMKSIAGSPIEIPVFCGRDCKPTNFPYNTLKISETNIHDKYEAAVK
jgi:hypothetical protein